MTEIEHDQKEVSTSCLQGSFAIIPDVPGAAVSTPAAPGITNQTAAAKTRERNRPWLRSYDVILINSSGGKDSQPERPAVEVVGGSAVPSGWWVWSPGGGFNGEYPYEDRPEAMAADLTPVFDRWATGGDRS